MAETVKPRRPVDDDEEFATVPWAEYERLQASRRQFGAETSRGHILRDEQARLRQLIADVAAALGRPSSPICMSCVPAAARCARSRSPAEPAPGAVAHLAAIPGLDVVGPATLAIYGRRER
ncbi:hypothetical protein [Frankia sp. AgPm24]|uniref:hypothetical protein n=1 Tax=Frankia sp. AgPm24 TaxID=631128 RepID=UPI00201092B2|nr:hypothetical protein [Frankia sp. AgPm24]